MSRDNHWIAPPPRPAGQGRPAGRRVASLATTTGTLQARTFDRLAARFLDAFRLRPEGSGCQGLWRALDAARARLVDEGSLTEAQAQRMREWVARDLEHLAAVLLRRPRGSAAEVLAGARRSPGAREALLGVLERSGDALYRVAMLNRPAVRRSGEVTCAGTVACTECGRSQRLASTTQLEPCRGCRGTSYSRGD